MRPGDPGDQLAAIAAGSTHWLTIHDDLLRGLAHAISNCLATVSASASVLDAGVVPDERFIAGLQRDAERLEGLLQLLRQLPRRADADLEPLLLTDATDTARRLVEEHPALRSRVLRVECVGDVMPVRAEPLAVVHATVVALLAAGRNATADVVVTLETIGDAVQLSARGGGGTDEAHQDLRERDVLAIGWLLAPSAGRAVLLPDGCAFTLPTLQASRRGRH